LGKALHKKKRRPFLKKGAAGGGSNSVHKLKRKNRPGIGGKISEKQGQRNIDRPAEKKIEETRVRGRELKDSRARKSAQSERTHRDFLSRKKWGGENEVATGAV